MKKIILASASPRRRELLSQAEIEYDLCIKSVDESVPDGTDAAQAAEMTAKKKAAAVSGRFPDTVVLGADTIVVLDGKIMGKPHSKQEATEMLMSLSGRRHEVITGVCLAFGGEFRTFHVVSKVKFYDLTKEEISHYVSTGEPMDKAGAYGIQGKGCTLIESIEGDYYNIVGLPVARVAREIKAIQKENGLYENN
ncbi:MAG: Maf family protein [Clostridiales bacterium]|nr:Maf family protein [Clostridiales bacterium]